MLGQKGEPNLFQQTAYLMLKSIDGNNKFYDLKIEETNSTKFFRLHVDGENDETTPQ